MRGSVKFWLAAATTLTLHAQVSVLTWHNDNARTGQNLQETILTPANVSSATFKKLFVIGVDGKVDAQPLYVPSVAFPAIGLHNALYVVSEHDSAYAFDADTGAQLWHVSLLGTNETPSDDRGCGQVTPEIGITSTPVIDPLIGPHGTIYMVAMSKNGGTYHQRLHALDLTTGAEQFNGPVEVQATYPGSGVEGSGGVQTFDAKQHKERAALLISNGVVYTSWSSHCDFFPYTGWVIGYSETSLARVSVLNLTPNGNDGAMWGSGSGPAVDSSGNLYLLTGNGTFDTTLTPSGLPVNGNYGNAFVKLSTAGALGVADYFTMSDTATESSGDVDLGSGGVMLLPPVNDAQGQSRALAVGAGKDHRIYVVDRNNLGKFKNPDVIYQELTSSLSGRVFASPAWFNGKLYYGAEGDVLKAFVFGNGAFGATPASQSPTGFGYPGTTPSISANGASNGIVWAAENAGTAVLHAYDAADLSRELYNSNQAPNARDHFGTGNKFIAPTVVNGKVYVATTNGVGVFGLLCSFALVPQSTLAPASGEGQIVNVADTSGCAWTATSDTPSWLTITSGSAGNGSGAVGYLVSPNPGSIQRVGTLSIAGQTFTVTQASGPFLRTRVGIFRSSVFWAVDTNGDWQWNVSDQYAWLGQAGDRPVVGDFDGDGLVEIGIFRDGFWAIDINHNGIWDGGDLYVTLGQVGDIPVVGDFNGDGRDDMGVFRSGFWAIDINHSGSWDVSDKYVWLGQAGDVPVAGDFNGDGIAEMGVFRSSGFWAIDMNRNGVWDASDKYVWLGQAGDLPVVGDFNGDGIAEMGVFRSGFWAIDLNRNGAWDATDGYYWLGQAGDVPVVQR